MKSDITYTLYFREDRVNENGFHSIYFRFCQNRKLKWISLPFVATKEQWNIEKGEPTKKHPHFKEISAFLNFKKGEISTILWNNRNQNNPLSMEQLVSKLNLGGGSPKVDLFGYFDTTYQRLVDLGRIGTANVFKEAKRQLVNFTGKKELSFYELNYLFLTKFDEWILKRGVSLTTCHIFMRTIKTLINNAIKEGVVEETFNPFKDISFAKYRKSSPKRKALNKESVDKLKLLSLDENSSLHRTRLFFLFSYYCRGINFRDMAYLKWSDINDNCLSYTRLKTKKNFIFRLEKHSLDILDQFKRNYNGRNSFVFPILSSLHSTPLQQDNRIKKVLRTVNKDLKALAGLLEVDEDLTFYAARHTFARVAKKANVSIAIISEALGHITEHTTNTYLDSFEQEELDNALNNIL